jgi:osmotically-inducible protein OsmY
MAETLDVEVRQRAERALKSSPIHALRELKVGQDGDGLVLTGSVETFYLKQLAQELVRSVARDCELVNSVRVQYVSLPPD